MRRIGIISLVSLIAVFSGLPLISTRAAATTTPLIVVLDGDLWAWSDFNHPLKQLTHWGGNQAVFMSPDNKYVAYWSIPARVMTDLKKYGGVGGGTMPYNIWVLNLETGEALQAASGDGNYDTSMLRSAPIWSTDSSYFAWTEVAGGNTIEGINYTELLATFNVNEKKQHIIASDIPMFTDGGVGFPSGVALSDYGFTLLSSHSASDSGPINRIVYIYGPTGNLISRTPITAQSDPYINWVKHENRWYVEVINTDATDTTTSFLIDPDNHKQLPLSTVSDIRTLDNSDEYCNAKALNGLCIRRVDDKGKWLVKVPGKADEVIDTGRYSNPDSGPYLLAISPDGLKLAFVDDSGCLFIHHDGITTPIDISRGKTTSTPKDCSSQGYIRDLTWGDQVRIAARTT